MITRTPENNPEWAKEYREAWDEEPPLVYCQTRCAWAVVRHDGTVSADIDLDIANATPADLVDVALAFLTIADKLTTVKENRECQ